MVWTANMLINNNDICNNKNIRIKADFVEFNFIHGFTRSIIKTIINQAFKNQDKLHDF